jgi:phenylacetate-CoA ligase
MNLHESFSKNIYWPLAQKLKGEYAARALEELSESQWQSQEGLLARQWRLVKQTVNKAFREVSYYKRICDEIGWELKNEDFSYEDFINIPPVEKETLRDRLTEFLNPHYRGRITEGRTSGSTGHSLTLYYCSEHESYSEAARWRAKAWWGVRVGSPQVSIWGRPFTGYRDRLKQKIKSYLLNTLIFSAFDLQEESLARIWRQISRFRPSIIYGYPSAIFPLAAYLKENDKNAHHSELKVVMVTAESCPSQHRSIIEEVFGCKTANEYGCSETGGFVYECPEGSWHISSEITFIEFLDKEGKPVSPGQTGEIYVTHLRNNYMPLIRYRVGDLGSPLAGVCTCGRGLPRMHVSVVKESDVFQLPDGRSYSSEIFDYINLAVIKTYPSSILQFRVIQKKLDHFEIEVVIGSDKSQNGEALFARLMKKNLGEDIHIHFKRTPHIARESTGKLRYFISEISKSQQ